MPDYVFGEVVEKQTRKAGVLKVSKRYLLPDQGFSVSVHIHTTIIGLSEDYHHFRR